MRSVSPKDEFVQGAGGQLATAFADILGNPVLKTAVETAMLQFLMEQVKADRFEVAAQQQHELDGAKRFVSIFLNLCDVGTPAKVESRTNLVWQHKPQPVRPAPAPQPVVPQPPQVLQPSPVVPPPPKPTQATKGQHRPRRP